MEEELLYTQEDLDEWMRTCEELQEKIKEQEQELTEFRNKIENGTLVELPCKVGDKVYFVTNQKIFEEIVSHTHYEFVDNIIDLANSIIYTTDIYDKEDNFYRLLKLGKSLFLTKERAEEKLKSYKVRSN